MDSSVLADLRVPPVRLPTSHRSVAVVRGGGPPRGGQEGFEILEAVADAAAELDKRGTAPAAPPGLQGMARGDNVIVRGREQALEFFILERVPTSARE